MNLISMKCGTFINPEQVVQFTTQRNGETRFLLSTGAEVTGAVWGAEELPERFIPTFPANPGFIAVSASRQNDGGFRYTQRSVVAWQRTPSGVFPLFEGVNDDNDYDAIIDPTGGVFDSDANMFESIEEWKREFEAEFGAQPMTQVA